jgi:hypothetical protein
MRDAGMRMERLLWRSDGSRRLPSQRALDETLGALPRGALWRLCEGNPHAPLYLLPTRDWIVALARECRALGRRVLEVGAGDGFVAARLALADPSLKVVATDSGAWERARARMTATEARSALGRRARGVRLGPKVLRLDAVAAVQRFRPDVVLAIWLPPGSLLTRLLQAPCRWVVEVGVPGGITAGGVLDRRHPHAPLVGPIERLARCRLDQRPAIKLHSRITLYRGGRS